MYYYAGSTNGFYIEDIHRGSVPGDAMEISEDEYSRLLNGQANGLVIAPDDDGYPELTDPPLLSDEQKIAHYRAAVGRHIDRQAEALGFDSIITAVTYADEPADPLNQSYGLALRAWRSACWKKCREVLGAWEGSGVEPTVDEVINSLPPFEGP